MEKGRSSYNKNQHTHTHPCTNENEKNRTKPEYIISKFFVASTLRQAPQNEKPRKKYIGCGQFLTMHKQHMHTQAPKHTN